MRIDEMRGFFSRIAPGSAAVKSNAASSVLPVPLQQQQNDDSLMLSKTGKLLGLHVKTSPSLTGEQKIGTDKTQKLPEWVEQADKILSQTINIFKRMHELATEAQDEKLTDLERVDKQIEIEGLRANLMAMPINMRSVLDWGGPSILRPSMTESNPLLAMTLPKMEKGDYTDGDYSSVLGRMKTRIANGEEWDVREAFAPEGFTRTTYDENGEEVVQAFAGEAWHVVGDDNILERQGGKFVDSGRKLLTVREELERLSPVIVMDAESATIGTKYLEEQIASVEERREYLKANFEDPFMKERTISSFERLIFPEGSLGGGEFLIDPTVAGAYLFSDGVHNIPMDSSKQIDRMKKDYSDISLTDGQTIEDGSAFTNNGEAVKILMSNLNKDPITSNVTIEELKQPKVIEIKGISQKRK